MALTFKQNDIVKFIHNEEPCIIYHVLDDTEQLIKNDNLGIVPHIKLEVIGLVPVSLIIKARGVAGNVFALDYKLFHQNQMN